jgi:hypothetical protein
MWTMWTWDEKKRKYVRPCRTCNGSGQEELCRRAGKCDCPWGGENEDIDHPENDNSRGIGHKLIRCNKCGSIWRIYYETTDDSWDVPAPERLPDGIPPREVKQ